MGGDLGKRAGQPRAIIVGGSMGGLFTALWLRQTGWAVDIYERAGTELAGRGAGIVTHPELLQVLTSIGIDVSPALIGVSVPGRRVFAQNGSISGQLELPQIVTSWGRLYGLLKQAFPAAHYHYGKSFVGVSEHATHITATFSDGTDISGDLLIGADGLFSRVRAHDAPTLRPDYAGYIAWRGLVDERDLSPHTRAELCDWFAFSLPVGEQMLGYPVAGPHDETDAGRRRFNFVWYRPAHAERDLPALLTDIDGIRYDLSIPPTRIRPDIVAAMRQDAERLLAPQFVDVVRATARPFIQAIMDLETPRMVMSPRTVILGDAAFVARPHVGMGVTKAAQDAAALAQALQAHPSDLTKALAMFDEARTRSGAAIVRRARHLGAYMQAQIATPEERRLAERYRTPEAIMSETAVAKWIDD